MPRPTDTIRGACVRSIACLASQNGGSGFCRTSIGSVHSMVAMSTGVSDIATLSARKAPIWTVTKCGVGPTGTTSATSLAWNIGRLKTAGEPGVTPMTSVISARSSRAATRGITSRAW
jgi:hypothetical protein